MPCARRRVTFEHDSSLKGDEKMLNDASVKCAMRWTLMCGFLTVMLVCGAVLTHAQENTMQVTVKPQEQQQTPAADEEAEDPAGEVKVVEPVFKDYRGVKIGMTADEARRKLGDKKADGKTQDFFQVEDNEMANLYYTKDGKVRAMSIIYTGKNVPADTAVLGETLAPDANGRIYKLIRYPNAGYWIAYSRTSGDSPVVTITMQRTRAAATAK